MAIDLSALNTGAGMLKRAPNKRDASAIGDNGDHDDAVAVPQRPGVRQQMRELARLFPVLQGPVDQRSNYRLNVIKCWIG
ncbi:MAG: hypothetical protein ACK6AD_06490 [Cyanobacteriota bacterium]|jgi:hypothetical protein